MKLRHGCLLGGLAALLSGLPRAVAQVAASEAIDIAVRVFPQDGAASPELRDRDFHLRSGHRKIAFTMEQFLSAKEPSVFALLDFSHCRAVQSSSVTELMPELNLMFKWRWRVSVLDAEDRQTPFEATLTDLSGADRTTRRSEAEAIRSLDQSAGLHLAFVLCTAPRELALEVVQAAEHSLAPLFAITPGAPVYGLGYEGSAGNVPVPTNEFGQQTAYFSDFGGMVRQRLLPGFWPLGQPTLAEAIQTAKEAEAQLYVLHATSAPVTPRLHLNVHIGGHADTKFYVVAQCYTQGATAPRITLDRR